MVCLSHICNAVILSVCVWGVCVGGDGHQDVGDERNAAADDAGTFYVLISCIYAFLWYVYLTMNCGESIGMSVGSV